MLFIHIFSTSMNGIVLCFRGTSTTDSKRFTVMIWTVAFYLMENCSSEIQDSHFASTVLEVDVFFFLLKQLLLDTNNLFYL